MLLTKALFSNSGLLLDACAHSCPIAGPEAGPAPLRHLADPSHSYKGSVMVLYTIINVGCINVLPCPTISWGCGGLPSIGLYVFLFLGPLNVALNRLKVTL